MTSSAEAGREFPGEFTPGAGGPGEAGAGEAGAGAGPAAPGAGGPGADADGPGLDTGGPGADAGGPGLDAGGPGLDAGGPGLNAGGPGLDAGGPGLDAGGPGLNVGDPGAAGPVPDGPGAVGLSAGGLSAGGSGAAPGELDLADRHALRRVTGLSTELTDVTEVEYRALRLERVVLVGVWTEGTLADAENSLRELSLLAETAGSVILDGLVQRRSRPDASTYIGAGKARELADLVRATGADTVICDGELAPGQLRSLEGVVKVKVVDRTALILDIFAQHARSKAGRAQVELAQLEYLLPRLRGWGENLARQAGGRVAAGGGIGSRGPGETKIETDRRRIRARTAKLRRQIAQISAGREVQRRRRTRRNVPSVAIAGYTNAGKSTLLNALTGAGVLVDDSLFATLDPAVRRARTPSGRWFTLTDTVGFVRHLPHQLVEAFRSTLEEVAEADLILHVVDGSDADPRAQIKAVREVLGQIGAAGVPELVVVNKADAADPVEVKGLCLAERGAVVVSARTGAGLGDLLAAIEAALPGRDAEVSAVVPYGRGDLVARAHREGEVLAVAHHPEGTHLTARVPPDLAAQLAGASPEPAARAASGDSG